MAGRPEKVGADWFKHYKGMRRTREIQELITEFGCEGYAICMAVFESLIDFENYKIEFQNEKNFNRYCEILSSEIRISVKKIKSVIEKMCFQKLINENLKSDFNLFSYEINLQMEELESKRKQDRERISAKRKVELSQRQYSDNETTINGQVSDNFATSNELSQNCHAISLFKSKSIEYIPSSDISNEISSSGMEHDNEKKRQAFEFLKTKIPEDKAKIFVEKFPVEFLRNKLNWILSKHKSKPFDDLKTYIIAVFEKTTDEQVQLELANPKLTTEQRHEQFREHEKQKQKEQQTKIEADQKKDEEWKELTQPLVDNATEEHIAEFLETLSNTTKNEYQRKKFESLIVMAQFRKFLYEKYVRSKHGS